MSNTRHRTTLAIGLPGRAPSREAQALARSRTMEGLPAGVFHTSDWVASALANNAPTVRAVIHEPTGEPFTHLVVAGQIVSISAERDAGQALIVTNWDDPVAWARSQAWRDRP